MIEYKVQYGRVHLLKPLYQVLLESNELQTIFRE